MTKGGGAEAVKVVVRCRPLNKKEQQDGRSWILSMDPQRSEVTLHNPKADANADKPRTFTFDRVFDSDSLQNDVFDQTARPILDSCMQGYNGTILAYGQTGTGKTFTMEGKEDPPELRGIIPNTFDYIFRKMDESEGKAFVVQASFLEIYNEEVRDLLAKNHQQKLELKEDPEKGPYVKGLTSFEVKNVDDFKHVLSIGAKNRSVGATLMNQDSSRSHSIFTISIEVSEGSDAGSGIHVGKLNLVDLAGSERQGKTGATGDRLKEATKINMSLSALGNVISSLVDGKTQHIPYRDSKLTRLLQDSLGGNTKTVMVANLGPADWNYDETLSTLRYAHRAKSIQNKPKINEDPKDAKLREFQEEIRRLQEQLQQQEQGIGKQIESGNSEDVEPDEAEIQEIREQIKKEMEDKMIKANSTDQQTYEAIKGEAEQEANEKLQKMLNSDEHSEEKKRQMSQGMKGYSQELQERMQAIRDKQNKKAELSNKLEQIQRRVHKGSLLEETQKKDEELMRNQESLEEQKRNDQERKQTIQNLQNDKDQKENTYSALKEEAEKLRGQVPRLRQQCKRVKSERMEAEQEFNEERENFWESIRELESKSALYSFIIEHFVPAEEAERVRALAYWDEAAGTWRLDSISSADMFQKKPKLDSRDKGNGEDILQLDLDRPSRTTVPRLDGGPNAYVQERIDAALADEFSTASAQCSTARTARDRPRSALRKSR